MTLFSMSSAAGKLLKYLTFNGRCDRLIREKKGDGVHREKRAEQEVFFFFSLLCRFETKEAS